MTTRTELKAEAARLYALATEAFSRGDKAEGRRLDDEAFDVERRAALLPPDTPTRGPHVAGNLLRAFGL